MSKRKPFHSLCALALVVMMGLGAIPALAQSQASTGEITGSVTDKQSAAIGGATIKATNSQIGLEQTVTANEQGFYKLVLLPPGVYKVEIDAKGFAKTTVNNVEVAVG